MLRSGLIVIFCSFCLFSFTAWKTTSDAWKNKVDPSVLAAAKSSNSPIEFIVLMKKQADVSKATQLSGKAAKGQYVFSQLQQLARTSQINVRQLLSEHQRPYQSLHIVNALHSSGDLSLIQELAQLPEVRYLSSNPSVRQEFPESASSATLRDPSAVEWGIDIIGAPEVWNMGYNGQGVVVAGQDTGYDWTHPAIQSRYRGWNGTDGDHSYNWHDAIHEISDMARDSINPCGLDATVPCDDHNHGTHTMGTIVGEDGENQIGVAPGAQWIACRNMERGNGTPITYLECYEWFLAPTDIEGNNPDPNRAPHVINNSWSCPESEGCNSTNWAMMETAINNLRAAGVVVVVSAGNGGRAGCSTVSTPSAMFEGSFSIGSVHPDDSISDFSSRGPVLVDNSNRMKPNVSAPGGQVRSCIRNGGYATYSGTSMAGPHVAGLVALMISAAPSLAGEVETIEDIIEQTALAKMTTQDCGGLAGTASPNNTYGFGRIQAIQAVEAAIEWATTTSTEQWSAAETLRVFPNPTNDVVSFEISGWNGDAQLAIFSLDGRQILSQTLQLTGEDLQKVSLGGFANGLYFYRLSNASNTISGRVMKQ